MSDHERFAQVTQRKGANERFAQKISAKKILTLFKVCFIYDFLKKIIEKISELLIFTNFLFFGEQCD